MALNSDHSNFKICKLLIIGQTLSGVATYLYLCLYTQWEAWAFLRCHVADGIHQAGVVDGDTWRGIVGPLCVVNGSVETRWTVCKLQSGGMREFRTPGHFFRELLL